MDTIELAISAKAETSLAVAADRARVYDLQTGLISKARRTLRIRGHL